ncbi:class I SAM-dependent RNA methyltransferase [Herbiconiux daphne]|uniref:Class I SAM-dependent RNA methyltransferase n=1 Tax=Herbiconiux daphne TaxID=2970914 RepID=A0ABT2H4I5_9MICO|nr:class I SAM-dependent RNA methyltransferase [Herbiconiux daphne]MCS5734852.1 class I SAM-dependent RNA methyltransferase [Herbiconiux daphne]
MSEDRDDPVSPSELVELQINNVAHGGVMVARLDGRVVFVADAVPGERVLARIADDSKSSFWRADTIEVLEASPARVPHVWPAAGLERAPAERAGGAEFGHIALERQRSLKGEVLTDALRRMGGVDRAVEVEAVGADAHADADADADADAGAGADGAPEPAGGRVAGTGWRTRVRLHVGPDGRVGPYAARSHQVVPVDDLPLATPALEQAAALGRRVHDAVAVELVETSQGEVRVIRVTEEQSKTGGRSRAGAKGRSERGRGRRAPARTGSDVASARGAAAGTPPNPATIVERVGEREFRLAENGFWQVHRDAAATLSDAVKSLTREDLFDPRAANHDLYGGVGLLAAAIGDRFGPATRITSVESDAAATDYASGNLAEWVGARAVTARVDRYLADLERQASPDDRRRLAAATMVIDPPRSGAGKEVVSSLARLGVAQVVYVACDPVAFARDVGTFREAGYELDALRAFDLFPHTHHVESVGVLVRA